MKRELMNLVRKELRISKGGRLSALVSSLWKPLLHSHTVQLLDCKSTSYAYCCGLGVLSDVIYFRLWCEHALHLQRCLQCLLKSLMQDWCRRVNFISWHRNISIFWASVSSTADRCSHVTSGQYSLTDTCTCACFGPQSIWEMTFGCFRIPVQCVVRQCDPFCTRYACLEGEQASRRQHRVSEVLLAFPLDHIVIVPASGRQD